MMRHSSNSLMNRNYKLLMKSILHILWDRQNMILLIGSTYDHMYNIMMENKSDKAIDNPCIHHLIGSTQPHTPYIQVYPTMNTLNNLKMYCYMVRILFLRGKNQSSTSNIVLMFHIWGIWLSIYHNWKLHLKRTQNYTKNNE